ncbi:putative ribonuclease H-like domain-containing protein [Tanacetum coccineum]
MVMKQIVGSTKKELCFAFEKLMHEKFQMSSIGELTFFLGLLVKQKKNGIFIGQDKYVEEILKKFGFIEVKTASTPMETQKPLLKDEDGEEVDIHMYRSMIGSLMYLDNLNDLTSCLQCVPAKTINGEVQLHALVDGKKIIITESTVRKDLQLEDANVVGFVPTNSNIIEQLTLMVPKTTTWNEFSTTMEYAIICLATNQKFNFSKFIFKGGGPRCQETIGDTIAQTRFENVSKHSNDSLLARGNTLRSDEDRLKLNELMELCTNLQTKVLDLEKTKTTQHNEIASLKRGSRTLKRKVGQELIS